MEKRTVRMREKFPDERREWRLPGKFYADDLVLCVQLEEGLRVIKGRSVEEKCK